MKEKMCGRLIGLLLIAALVAIPISPVMAADSSMKLSENADTVQTMALAGQQENIEGFDQDSVLH